MKKLIVVLLIILFIIASLAVTKNTIVRVVISRTLWHLTGLNLSIQNIKLDIPKTLIDISGLKIYNPKGYPDKVMADLPFIYVDYNLGPLINGEIYLPELRLYLKELNIIKNSEGVLNISSIKTVKEQKRKIPEKEKARTPPIHIDLLQLKIGKVVYKDYSRGTPPQVKEFNINLDEKYENITDTHALVSLIIVKALKRTAIERLANFDLSIVTDRLPPGLKETAKLVTKSAAGVKKVAEESVGKATQTVKKALTEVFQFPATEKRQ